MEERLDDAINVLRNHAEAPELYPQDVHHPHQPPPGETFNSACSTPLLGIGLLLHVEVGLLRVGENIAICQL